MNVTAGSLGGWKSPIFTVFTVYDNILTVSAYLLLAVTFGHGFGRCGRARLGAC